MLVFATQSLVKLLDQIVPLLQLVGKPCEIITAILLLHSLLEVCSVVVRTLTTLVKHRIFLVLLGVVIVTTDSLLMIPVAGCTSLLITTAFLGRMMQVLLLGDLLLDQ